MSLAFRTIRVYARFSAMGVVAFLVLVVLGMNQDNRATIWFFHKFEDIPVIWLMLVTGLGSIVAAWVTRGFFRVIGEWRRLRRERELAEKFHDHKKLADGLAEQEKRIDTKLKDALSAVNTEEADEPAAQ